VPELLVHSDDGDARCVHCGALAVGPCARCESPVCGDCCVLTTGGANVYAICLGCNARAGKDLRRGWLTVIGWFLTPILGLAAAIFLLSRC
jgi:hypothetical protein